MLLKRFFASLGYSSFLSVSRSCSVFRLGVNQYCTEKDDPIDSEMDILCNRMSSHLLPEQGHRVMILQPNRSRFKLAMKSGTEQDSLFEARALINTLESWTLVAEERANMKEINSKTFFTKGIYEELTEKIRPRDDITAVFINWSVLSPLQRIHMEKSWKKVIYDRFLMVLQIFKLHAKTGEAKLQVQLAEIPYFKQILHGYHRRLYSDNVINQIERDFTGLTLNSSSLEEKYFLLKTKEHKIKEKLKELEEHRDRHRDARTVREVPIISVVGYTNAGKTSLIKLLSRDKKIEPKDCFFATLDATYHNFYLKLNEENFGMNALLLDSIGFLSEIPTVLIAAFRSTLREAMDTDLIVHVVDISSDYWQEQMDFTMETLRSFKLPESKLGSIIVVGTKIDRVERSYVDQLRNRIPNFIPISNLTGENIDVLHQRIAEFILIEKVYITKQIKVDQSTSIYQWLQKNAVIQKTELASDGEKLLLEILFTKTSWQKFQSQFLMKK